MSIEASGREPIDRAKGSGIPSETRMRDDFANLSKADGRRIGVGLRLVPVLLLAMGTPTLPAGQAAQRQVNASPGKANGLPRGEKHEFRHEIDRQEETWRSALLKGDATELASLLADDYMAISASGTLQTKAETLANLRSGRMHFTALDVSDRKVRFYGTTALVTSLAAVHGATADGDISGSYRYTRVYVRDPRGAWKAVSFEASKIPDSEGHK
jgi:ketosteroid isomerase-like protein